VSDGGMRIGNRKVWATRRTGRFTHVPVNDRPVLDELMARRRRDTCPPDGLATASPASLVEDMTTPRTSQ
jgi:hypothetical protein